MPELMIMPDIKDGVNINIQYLPEVVLGRIALRI